MDKDAYSKIHSSINNGLNRGDMYNSTQFLNNSTNRFERSKIPYGSSTLQFPKHENYSCIAPIQKNDIIRQSPCLLSPNRLELSPSLLHHYNDSNQTGLINNENTQINTSNKLLSRSNCDLKNQLRKLEMEVYAYRNDSPKISDLKAYIEYLSEELKSSGESNKELVKVYKRMEFLGTEVLNENETLKDRLIQINKTKDVNRNNSQDTLNNEDHQMLLRIKDKKILELNESLKELSNKSVTMKKTLQDYEGLIGKMKKNIDILDSKDNNKTTNYFKDSSKMKQEMIQKKEEQLRLATEAKSKIMKEIKDKVIFRDSLKKKIDEKEKIDSVDQTVKVEIDNYLQKITSLYAIIEDRDITIMELKNNYDTLNKAFTNKSINQLEHNQFKEQKDEYKSKYDEEVEKNGQLLKHLKELKDITDSLIESRDKMKQTYVDIIAKMQDTLEQTGKKYINIEETVKENELLRKQNEFLFEKINSLPEIDKTLQELINENDKLKKQIKPGTIVSEEIQSEDNEYDLNINRKSYDIKVDNVDHAKSQSESQGIPTILSSKRPQYCLYNICMKKMLAYDFNSKTYKAIQPTNYSSFLKDYQEKGSITYNTLEGMFVITGKDYDILFYYSQNKNSFSQILKLKYNHEHGSMIMDDTTKSLIFLSGIKTAKVEQFCFDPFNHSDLPSLCCKRPNASYCFIDHCLYCFFGFNYETGKVLETIEMLDLDNPKEWKSIEYKSKDNKAYSIAYHIAMNIGGNEVLLLGGVRGNEGKFNSKIISMNMDTKLIEESDKDLPNIEENHFYMFDSNSQYNIMWKDDQTICMVAMDNMNNVHVMDSGLKYDIIQFADVAESK